MVFSINLHVEVHVKYKYRLVWQGVKKYYFICRDGEDLDELLERQADMIRYLQQHNANLGRRILELQSQTME